MNPLEAEGVEYGPDALERARRRSWGIVVGLALGLDRAVDEVAARFLSAMVHTSRVWDRAAQRLDLPACPLWEGNRAEPRVVMRLGDGILQPERWAVAVLRPARYAGPGSASEDAYLVLAARYSPAPPEHLLAEAARLDMLGVVEVREEDSL